MMNSKVEDLKECPPMAADRIAALADIFFAAPDGGIISGQGYSQPDSLWVEEAVNKFFGRFNWNIAADKDGTWRVVKQPLHISFIIPAYNCGRTIGESMDSIIHGNFEEGDEIIVTDDGSTDKTRGIVKKYAAGRPAVKLIEHPQNLGGGAARNTCIKHSRQPLIFCLDSDNVLEKDSVAKLKRHLIESASDAAAFQEIRYFTFSPDVITHKWVYSPGQVALQDALAGHIVPPSSGNYLFTKNSWETAGGYPEVALDAWGFGLRQLANNCKMTILENTGYFHRYGHESYWVRAAAKGGLSEMAAEIIEPFTDQLEQESLSYLRGENVKSTWFFDLDRIPLRVKGATVRKYGEIVYPAEVFGLRNRLRRKIGILVKQVSAYLKRLIRF